MAQHQRIDNRGICKYWNKYEMKKIGNSAELTFITSKVSYHFAICATLTVLQEQCKSEVFIIYKTLSSWHWPTQILAHFCYADSRGKFQCVSGQGVQVKATMLAVTVANFVNRQTTESMQQKPKKKHDCKFGGTFKRCTQLNFDFVRRFRAEICTYVNECA